MSRTEELRDLAAHPFTGTVKGAVVLTPELAGEIAALIDGRTILAELVAEVESNQASFLEWWALKTRGVRFPAEFSFFTWKNEALRAAHDLIDGR